MFLSPQFAPIAYCGFMRGRASGESEITMRITTLALLLLAVRPGLAQDTSLYTSIRNNDLTAIAESVRRSGGAGTDAAGNTPLMVAAAVGSADSMRLLLDSGADPNAANRAGATPLMWCAGDLTKVKLLLNRGARVDAVSKAGRTPLQVAAYNDGAVETARLLIARGANVNARDKQGGTVLAAAAENNNTAFARLLIQHGADVNAADPAGFTPLHFAAGSGRYGGELVRLLLAHGARVNATSSEFGGKVLNGPILLGRFTPLHFAVTASYESSKALVDAGADVNALDIRNQPPLSLAVATDHADIRTIKLLLDHGARRDPAVRWARLYNNPQVLAALGMKAEAPDKAPTQPRAETASAIDEVRGAISRALAPCQSASASFLEKGGCVACHAQNSTGVAAYVAKPLALNVDFTKEQAQERNTLQFCTDFTEDLLQLTDLPGGSDQAVNLLLHLMEAGTPASVLTDALVHSIAANQRKEGDWPIAAGVRPPLEDGSFSVTAKAVRVLRHFGAPALKTAVDARIARAARWLAHAEPTTTEDRSMQILGLVWAGNKPATTRVRQLIARQRPDGGWGQTDNLACDAYATGEALWALHEAGMAATDPVYRRGVAYLLQTQKTDGSWHVATRALSFQPYFESGFPHGHDQWISQAGTAYAAIALTFAAK